MFVLSQIRKEVTTIPVSRNANKTERWSIHTFGLAYIVCIAGFYFDILSGPAFERVLRARPEVLAQLIAQVCSLFSGEVARTLLFTVSYGALCGAYICALYRLPSRCVTQRTLFLWAIVFVCLLIPLPYHYSSDIVGYAQEGRVLAAYHQNPYLHTLAQVRDRWASFRDETIPSPYGPVITVLSAVAAGLGGSSLFWTLGVLKLMMAGCYLLTGWLVSEIVEEQSGGDGGFGSVLFFLWNPLVLFELIGQGHNDAIMMALMMCGFYLIVRKRLAKGLLFSTLSVLAKFTTAVLLPLQAYWLIYNRKFGELIKATVATGVTILGCYLLFFQDARSLQGLQYVSGLAWGSPTWLGGVLLNGYWHIPLETARRTVQLVLLVLFVVFLIWRAMKVNSEPRLLRECSLVLIFFLLVVANQINPWYLAPIVPLVAVAETRFSCSIVIFLSAWPVATYFRPFFYRPALWSEIARTILFYGILLAILWRQKTSAIRPTSGA